MTNASIIRENRIYGNRVCVGWYIERYNNITTEASSTLGKILFENCVL